MLQSFNVFNAESSSVCPGIYPFVNEMVALRVVTAVSRRNMYMKSLQSRMYRAALERLNRV